ncbi:MAG TPA: hypothetical protein VF624_09125, partial [Tepidisphaeraceae bacterium]
TAFIDESTASLAAHEPAVGVENGAATQPAESVESVAKSCRDIADDYTKLRRAVGEMPGPLVRQAEAVAKIYDRTRRLRVKAVPTEEPVR